MKVTNKTKYKDFVQCEPFLTKESVAELKVVAEKSIRFCHTLTLEEFFGILDGDLSVLGDLQEPSVFQVYWAKRFKDFCEEFSKSCEALTIEDPEMAGTDSGCVQITPQENTLLFVRSYFGLRSFDEAGKITIGEYILARKDAYNKWLVRKNYEKKQLSKMKKK